MSVASGALGPVEPPLCNAITHVSGMGANEQMLRAHAGGSVAGMTYEQTIWDGTVMHPPREPVRSLSVAIDVYDSVSEFPDCAGPKPTGFGFINVD